MLFVGWPHRTGEIGLLMNIKEIKELIEAVSQNGITELEVERAGTKVRIKKEAHPAHIPLAPSSPGSSSGIGHPGLAAKSEAQTGAVAESQTEAALGMDSEDVHIVRSPIVGTFYRAPNPDSEPFVKVGDVVEPGRILCIIEAMKLMNEIEAEVSGEVTHIYVENNEPVEFGQALFGIRLLKNVQKNSGG
jgi:acetyl-CoA carboxylase biotin carboxyl carrier protein